MKIFLSWSGADSESHVVARLLRDWLPDVYHAAVPFISSSDIEAGTRWQTEVGEQLQSTSFGIMCITQENQLSPWLNFEAGALSRAVGDARVIPLAIGMKVSDIKMPLSQFQAQELDRQGLENIVRALNRVTEQPLGEDRIVRAVQRWWPQFEEELACARDRLPLPSTPPRPSRDMLEEVLLLTRDLSRRADTEFQDALHRTNLRPYDESMMKSKVEHALSLTLPEGATLPRVTVKPRQIRILKPVAGLTAEAEDELRERLRRIGNYYNIEIVWAG